MEEVFYSIEQVAERLGLHAKTVRNYVREGRLRGVRIGKQYRVAAADLAAMTGQPVAVFEPGQVARTRHVEVSSVVEVEAVSPECSDRVTNMLLAAANGNSRTADDPVRVQTIYHASRGRLKVILTGSLETTASLLKVIHALIGVETA